MSQGPTRDEWLTALREAGLGPKVSDARSLTIKEFAALMDLSYEIAARRLEALVLAGKAIKTSKQIVCANNAQRYCVSYRLVESLRKAPSSVRTTPLRKTQR